MFDRRELGPLCPNSYLLGASLNREAFLVDPQDESTRVIDSLRMYKDLQGKYLRPYWPLVALLGVLLFIGTGLQLVTPQLVRRFIDIAEELRAEGRRVIGLMNARKPPFNGGWERWRPHPSWGTPELPSGWHLA